MVLGDLDGCPILASETCALDIIGARYVRDVENGEIIIASEEGIDRSSPSARSRRGPASSSTSTSRGRIPLVHGLPVYDLRKQMGAQLSREAPVDADVVVPVPDSGVPAALGYAQEAGIPYELGIIRNHYVGRTFIQPTQTVRELGVRLKHSANRSVVAGKRHHPRRRSIVRGTTSVKIVQMMREAGAKEVHFRISSPPITHPETTHRHARARQAARRDHAGRNAPLHRLRHAGLPLGRRHLQVMGEPGRDNLRPQFTDHCFTGDYPTPITDQILEVPQAAALDAGRPGLIPRPARTRAFNRATRCRSPSQTAPRSSPARRARHRPGGRPRLCRRRRARHRRRPHPRRAGGARRRDPGAGRHGHAGTGQPVGHGSTRPPGRRDPRALGQADILLGNGAVLGPITPLGHVTPKG